MGSMKAPISDVPFRHQFRCNTLGNELNPVLISEDLMEKQIADKLVSVVMPVFNTPADYLLEAIDSVVNQTLESQLYQLVLVNDASTNEETRELLSDLQSAPQFKGVGHYCH